MEVVFDQLRCRAGDKTILKNLTGRVSRNRLVGIMGPTGAGKSTLLNALAHKQPRLYVPRLLVALCGDAQ